MKDLLIIGNRQLLLLEAWSHHGAIRYSVAQPYLSICPLSQKPFVIDFLSLHTLCSYFNLLSLLKDNVTKGKHVTTLTLIGTLKRAMDKHRKLKKGDNFSNIMYKKINVTTCRDTKIQGRMNAAISCYNFNPKTFNRSLKIEYNYSLIIVETLFKLIWII